jgi:hypothetical protein
MKAIYCGECHDIRGLDPSGASVCCRCGNTAGRIGDAEAGDVLMQGRSKSMVRVLGIANGFIGYTFEYAKSGPPGDHAHDEWRDFHEWAINAADDAYLFSAAKRGCPFVVLRVGETSDVNWDSPSTPAD